MITTLIILGIIVYLLIGIVLGNLLDQVEGINISNEYERVLSAVFFPLLVIWILLRSTGNGITRKILGKKWEY
jgi:DNA-binding protein Fis